MNSLSFDATSNMQHVNPCSSAISSQYVVSPHDLPMNERIDYDNANYLANCSQNSAPYTNVHIHNLASYVTSNLSRIKENSARCLGANTHDLVSRVTSNHSRINGNSAPYAKINAHNSASYFAHDQSQISEILARHSSTKTHDSAQPIANNCSRTNENLAIGAHANNHDSASYDALKSSQIEKDLAHTRNSYGSSKWKVPAYHRPYPLHIDYLKTPDGWWIPNFYEFSGEDDKTVVEYINVYIS
jgi:hypothetical protein